MTFTESHFVDARIAWDARREQPAAVIVGGRRLVVRRLVWRRDELAAFPAERGPRVTYLLATDSGTVRVVYDARRRSWQADLTAPLAMAA